MGRWCQVEKSSRIHYSTQPCFIFSLSPSKSHGAKADALCVVFLLCERWGWLLEPCKIRSGQRKRDLKTKSDDTKSPAGFNRTPFQDLNKCCVAPPTQARFLKLLLRFLLCHKVIRLAQFLEVNHSFTGSTFQAIQWINLHENLFKREPKSNFKVKIHCAVCLIVRLAGRIER